MTYSAPFDLQPSAELHALMYAMNIYARERDALDDSTLLALAHALCYGDACANCRDLGYTDAPDRRSRTRWPYRLDWVPADPLDATTVGGWSAYYFCHVCRNHWKTSWADRVGGLFG